MVTFAYPFALARNKLLSVVIFSVAICFGRSTNERSKGPFIIKLPVPNSRDPKLFN